MATVDPILARAHAAFERYKREHPEEYTPEALEAARDERRRLAYACTGFHMTNEEASAHIFECPVCGPQIGFITIDIELPRTN